MVTIDICLLTFNRYADVARCATSLEKHAPEGVRVHWLDNGSTDNTPLYLQNIIVPFWEDWTYSASPENLGVGGGRNRQIDTTRGDLIVFLDSDTTVSAGWVDKLMDALKPENVGIAGPAGSWVDWADVHPFRPAPAGECDVVSGWCMAVKREVIEAGGCRFDPAYGMFWEEDSDFCMQARAAGWDVVCTGEIGVAHHPGQSGDGLSNREKNLSLFRDKWRGQGLTKQEGAY